MIEVRRPGGWTARWTARRTREAMLSGLIFVGGVIYVSVFWSRLPSRLPAPLNQCEFLFEKLVGPWWYEHVLVPGPGNRSHYLLWATGSLVTGLLIPIAALLIARKRLSDVGLGWPNRLGWRFTVAGVVLSIPFGLWVLASNPQAMADVWNDFRFIGVCGGIVMISNHFLISGVFVALLLPERRLPDVHLAPAKGPGIRRWLQWLGFAQVPQGYCPHPVIAWFGLTTASLFAILASGLLFLIAHVGEHGLELALALPGGAAIAYMTLRSHSIWPGLLAHYALNLIPLGLWLLFR